MSEDSNLGLGCGNPQAIAALKPGEMMLDLGVGAGGRATGRAIGPRPKLSVTRLGDCGGGGALA